MVTADGANVVGHAGARMLSDLADAVGLTEGLSVAMAPTKQRRRGHDRGHVLVDVAVMIADGGEAISDLAVLRNQPELFGPVASTPTAWRTLEAVDAAALERIAMARAEARKQVWAAGADPGFYVIDFDATLISAHSEKQGAAPTYKRGFGHHPLLAFLDATGEALGAILRPGNAGSNTAADHIELLAMALTQLPVDPATVEVVARADSAGLTHGFVNACRAANVAFSIGHDLTGPIRSACLAVPERRWLPAITADGADERPGAEIAEITDLVDLGRWPTGTRAIVRREEPHPGAQLTFSDVAGHRFQVFITDQPDADIAYLEALQRGRGRAEKLICDTKDTGLANLPSADFAINVAWLTMALTAHDLLVWTKLVCLQGDLARAEPKRLRYTLLHTAAQIVRGGRRTRLRLARGWPWATELAAAFDRIHNFPLRA
ncbi:MAG: IS1380-like element ISMsm3 family transposase [Acidimicrobiales bacterium]